MGSDFEMGLRFQKVPKTRWLLAASLDFFIYKTRQVYNLFQEVLEQPFLGFRIAKEKAVNSQTDKQTDRT